MWRRALWLLILLAILLSAQQISAQQLSAQEKEQPVALVLSSVGGRVLRLGSELPLAAKPGDLLFIGDTLLSEQGRITYLFCPDKSSQTLLPGGQVEFQAERMRLRKGETAEKREVGYCLLPEVERAPSATRYHSGDTFTRDLPSPAGDFQARLAALPQPSRDALVAELAPIDTALAANPEDGAARVTRATVLQKYNLTIDARAEYQRLSATWKDADWTRLLVHDAAPEPERPPQDRPGQTFALLVGISKYQKLAEAEQLHFANADATTFNEFLRSPRGGAVPPDNIILLTDAQASTAAIRSAMESFLKVRAGKNDTLILFIAAHGTVAETAGGRQAFIVTNDSDPQDLGSTALPMADVQALMQDQLSKVGRVVLYVDVCRAGIIGTIQSNAVNGSVEQLFEEEGDLFGFLASRPREFSIESERFGGGHGAFTYFLLRGLNGDADGYGTDLKDGKVTVNEVIDYVRDQVREATRNRQHPVERVNVSGDPELGEVAKDGIALLGWSQAANTEIASRALAAPTGSTPAHIRNSVQLSVDEEQFVNALQAGRLLPGTADNAFDILQRLRQQLSPDEYLLLEDDLRVALEDRAQQILLRYLTGDQIPQTRSDFESGAIHLQAAGLLTPNSPYTEGREAFFQGRMLIFDKRYPEAVELLERALRLDPNGAYSYNALGIAYLEQANYGQAVLAFRDAARRAPYWAYPLHNLALAYTEMGNYQDAIRAYQTAMTLASQYSYLPYNLGLLYQRLNRRRDAEQAYRKAIALTPNLAAAYNGLGVLYASMGRARQAEAFYRESLSKDPSLLAARHNLALLLSSQPNSIPEAIALLRKNLAQSSDSQASALLLAELLARQGDTAEAISQYQKIVSDKPDYVAARMALADLFVKSGQPDEALEQLAEILERQPRNAGALERTGDIKNAQGKFSEATAAYQQAMEIVTDGKTRKALRSKMGQ